MNGYNDYNEGVCYTIDGNNHHMLNVYYHRGIFKDGLWLGKWA